MRSNLFMVACVFSILVMLTFAVFEGENLAKEFGFSEKAEVLVFVIPSIENARRVRAAISDERIEWQGQEGLALVGGRVVALSLDDAGDVIEGAGWVDRPIRIVRLEDPGPDEGTAEENPAGSDVARLARLRSLVAQPTLSRGEQMFVLAAMNDGIEL